MSRLAFVFTCLLISSAGFGQDKAPSGSAEKGQQAYLKYQCNTCHGTVGQGGERGAGPRLLPNLFPWAGFEHQVRTPRQDMPAYRKPHVSDQDLADMYAYLQSVKPSRAPNDIPQLPRSE